MEPITHYSIYEDYKPGVTEQLTTKCMISQGVQKENVSPNVGRNNDSVKRGISCLNEPGQHLSGGMRFVGDAKRLKPSNTVRNLKLSPRPVPPPVSSEDMNITECVLNGDGLKSDSVYGFTIDMAVIDSSASRVILPASVYFYDSIFKANDYAYHASGALGKEGYAVPKTGKLRFTLFNTVGTTVSIFIVDYNLTDMPASSCTFLRQNVTYVPKTSNGTSRYVIEIRFRSAKSGTIFVYDVIKMALFPKCDMNSAIDLGNDKQYEVIVTKTGPDAPKYIYLQ